MFNFKDELSRYQPIMELDRRIPAPFPDAGLTRYFAAYCEREKTDTHTGLRQRSECHEMPELRF